MTGKPLGTAATQAERALEGVLAGIACWSGRILGYAPVSGGISNTNWRVWVEGCEGSFFVKVPGRGTELFIDRNAAFAASRQAERLGIGPRVYDYAMDRGIEIGDFLEGFRPSSNRDFLDPALRAAVVRSYLKLHASPLLPLTKTVFDLIDEHVEQIRTLGARTPRDLAPLLAAYGQARAAITAAGIDLVPSFNDPMPGNFLLDAAGKVLLIDYEYASNNDRCYDLGVWCGEMFFTEAMEREVVEAYFGRYQAPLHARLVVYRALADLKWATWSMVQNEVSTLAFDYYKYGAWKFMRARSIIDDPRWPSLLRAL